MKWLSLSSATKQSTVTQRHRLKEAGGESSSREHFSTCSIDQLLSHLSTDGFIQICLWQTHLTWRSVIRWTSHLRFSLHMQNIDRTSTTDTFMKRKWNTQTHSSNMSIGSSSRVNLFLYRTCFRCISWNKTWGHSVICVHRLMKDWDERTEQNTITGLYELMHLLFQTWSDALNPEIRCS